jgi:hypothetical protein
MRRVIGRLVTVWSVIVPPTLIAGEPGHPSQSTQGDRATSTPVPFAVLGDSKVGDGRLMAPFYDYVIWPHAVVTKDQAFCVFGNAKGQPIAMTFDLHSRRWSDFVRISEFGLRNDDHGNPALAIDGDGYLHVFYGCHGGPMRHAKSRQPYDIATWDEKQPPTAKATYPQVMPMADGRMLLFYRAGGHMEPWTLRESKDGGTSWRPPQPIVEMRRDPPDRLAAAYCDFLPGADRRSVHLFWCHKDDNAARVTSTRPHPWRPLKYPGLHEAVYRYNVYYLKRQADGEWCTAKGDVVSLPVSKSEADAKCLVYDSGDEFTFLGTHIAIDAADRPYLRFGTGVVDWVKYHGNAQAAVVPVTQRFAHLNNGKWRVTSELPADWPKDVVRTIQAPGPLAFGHTWPSGRWFIFAGREATEAARGCSVYLYNDETGYVRPDAGPTRVD